MRTAALIFRSRASISLSQYLIYYIVHTYMITLVTCIYTLQLGSIFIVPIVGILYELQPH